jgi:hypothetical protein
VDGLGHLLRALRAFGSLPRKVVEPYGASTTRGYKGVEHPPAGRTLED